MLKKGPELIEAKCNHCGRTGSFEKKFQGNIKKIEEQTGMLFVPIRPHLSSGKKLYCQECINIISDSKKS